MQFIGCSYTGECTADGKRAHRYGEFTFANGDKYVGEFKDGVMHGHGVIFYKKHKNGSNKVSNNNSNIECCSSSSSNVDNEKNALLHKEREREEEQWDGQYRGVWKDGVNVSGCYVFADGLVYGGESSISNEQETEVEHISHEKKEEEEAEEVEKEHKEKEEKAQRHLEQSTSQHTNSEVVHVQRKGYGTAPYNSIAAAWPYCQSDDHRLWNEHLRNLIPVLPYETALGGTALQDEREQAIYAKGHVNEDDNDGVSKKSNHSCWSLTPNFVPTYCETEMTPPAFAQQQPRIPSDLPLRWWNYEGKNKTQTQRTMSTLAQHTEPLIPEHDQDEYPAESHYDALGNEIESSQRQGHTIDVPNYHRLYPMSIVDGGRRLTPALSSTQGYRYVNRVHECDASTTAQASNEDGSNQSDEASIHA